MCVCFLIPAVWSQKLLYGKANSGPAKVERSSLSRDVTILVQRREATLLQNWTEHDLL